MTILEKAYENRSKKINKVEKVKSQKNPMETFKKLKEIAQGGYDNLSKEDSTYFLKCFGLFDKGEHFMLRIRIPAGQLTTDQALAIGDIARKYGNDYIDITTRMQIELRYIEISNIATVIEQLDNAGISTFQTGVDNPRNIITDPLDGLAHDNIIQTKPIIDQMQKVFIENPNWISTLPRKFNTAILGSMSNSCNIYGHDCCFVLAHKNGIWGFNVYLGGRVGMQALDANIFLEPQDVVVFFEAILSIFKEFGYRDNRNKNRLIYLIKDVGMETIINAVKKITESTFEDAGEVMVQSKSSLFASEKILCKDNKFAYKIVVPSGITSGSDLIQVATITKEHNISEIRLSYDQNIYIPHIDQEIIEKFNSSEIIKKYSQFNHIYFQNLVACAGKETCAFGVIPNKPDAIEMANFLYSEVKITNGTVRMNWSACPKGCGVHGIADIGFEGCKVKQRDGTVTDAVHIVTGGKITNRPKEAIMLHKSMPISIAKHHVKYLLSNYSKHKLNHETYEEFDTRYIRSNYTTQAMRFFTTINYLLNETLGLDISFDLDSNPDTHKKENLEVFDFGLRLFSLLTGEERYKAIDDFEPILTQPRKIKKDTVLLLNPAVPLDLSIAIYKMTHENKKQRTRVFTEFFESIKEL